MRSNRFSSACIAGILFILTAVVGAHAQGVFVAGLSLPGGITTDGQGNVFAISDGLSTTFLTKYSPQGAILFRVNLGGVDPTEYAGSRLVTDPASGLLLLLTPRGQILLVSPANGQISPYLDLRLMTNQTFSNVWDVLAQRYRPMVLVQPSYGDIAMWKPEPNLMDLLVTGTSAGFQFVSRVRLDFVKKTWSGRVILTSVGSTAGRFNLPPGIAINAEGTALTTLPYNTVSGFASGLVRFNAAFPESPNDANLLPRFISGGFSSRGMTTDNLGNFYVASGQVGIQACGPTGSGALAVIPRTVDRLSCINLGAAITSTQDIAVSSSTGTIYFTIENLGVIGQIGR